MRLDRRFGWLGLFAVAIWLSVVEADRSAVVAPLHPMSIRITVEADGAMRVEAPDGTNVTFAGAPFEDRSRVGEMLRRLRKEMERLDPRADPERHFEVVVDPRAPFLRVAWVQQCAFGVRSPRARRFSFSLRGADGACVPYVWTDINEQGPGTAIIPFRVPMAKVRLRRSPVDADGPAGARAIASIGEGDLHGDITEEEGEVWAPIEPRREAVRDWILLWKSRPPELVGVVELPAEDLKISFGSVFEVLRGFTDAGLLIDFRLEWRW